MLNHTEVIVHSTSHHSTMWRSDQKLVKSFSPDNIIPNGWLGSKHQLIVSEEWVNRWVLTSCPPHRLTLGWACEERGDASSSVQNPLLWVKGALICSSSSHVPVRLYVCMFNRKSLLTMLNYCWSNKVMRKIVLSACKLCLCCVAVEALALLVLNVSNSVLTWIFVLLNNVQ